MRTGNSTTVSPADRRRLLAVVNDRNAVQKHVWRCRIVVLTADGVGTNETSEVAGRSLPGRDISPVFTNPESAKVNEARESVLFTYSGLLTNDSEVFRINTEAKVAGKKPIVQLIREGYFPNMKKRGSLRTVFDGRYKFTCYFSPLERNSPRSLDELYGQNDVELFDLMTDPGEVKNLAANRQTNGKLILTMSGKLESIIKTEIGFDDGREMPDIPTVDWTIDRPDL